MAPGFDAWELRSFFRASECLLEFAETAPGVVAIAPLRFFLRSAESREDLAVDPRPDLRRSSRSIPPLLSLINSWFDACDDSEGFSPPSRVFDRPEDAREDRDLCLLEEGSLSFCGIVTIAIAVRTVCLLAFYIWLVVFCENHKAFQLAFISPEQI